MFYNAIILYGSSFLGNCCHAKLRTPPRHIANITGAYSIVLFSVLLIYF